MNDLKINVIETEFKPAEIKFNKKGIEEELELVLIEYKDIELKLGSPSSTIKEVKSVLAKLNKAKSALDKFRKDVKGKMTEGVKLFEADVKDLVSKIDDVYLPLKDQYDNLEKTRVIEKLERINILIKSLVEKHDLRPKNENLLTQSVAENKYTNKTVAWSKIESELTTYASQLALKQNEDDQSKDYIEKMVKHTNKNFKVSLPKTVYIAMLSRMSPAEIMMKITEDAEQVLKDRETKNKEEPLPGQITVDNYHSDEDDEVEKELFEEVYTVYGTENQLNKLENYMLEKGIDFKVRSDQND